MSSIPEAPTRWGQDPLSAFIDLARHNTFASFQELREGFRLLDRIDRLYLDLIDYLDNSPDWFTGFFVLRAHSAFRASCRLILSGQVTESYVVLRFCLEAGIYGLYMARRPETAAIWLDRHRDEQSLRRCKDEFRIGALLAFLHAESSGLGDRVSELYEHTIDFGAHPNERALLTNLNVGEGEQEVRFELRYLSRRDEWFHLCLHTTARVGVRVLEIFKRIYRHRMELTGLDQRLKDLKRDQP